MVAAAVERPRVFGSQQPRILVVPDGVEHPKWSEVLDFISALGVELDPWQLEVLRVALLRSGDFWAAFAVAVCAPRQNGKNGILEVRELIGPLVLGEKLLIHTAHLADTSKEGFRRLDDLIDANEWLSRQVRHIWRTNGHEAIEFMDGRRIRFRTRTRGGGRGFSGSPVFFDEAMFLPEVSMGSILPVISAQPDPQIWYMGSAVDQAIMDEGVVFARVRDRALSGDHKRLAYFEWSHDAEVPDEVDEGDAADPSVWAWTNPAFGVRVSRDYIEAEHREMDARTFAVERLGVGDWPPVDGSAAQVIPVEKWDALADDPAASGARLLDPILIAYDVTPDRSRAAIAVAGRRADGLGQIEIPDHRPGTAWVAPRVADLLERHGALSVHCTGKAAESLLPKFDEVGVNVEVASTSEYAHACGVFFDVVEEERLRHLGGLELRAAIKGATKRELEDSWTWSRRHSAIDISPLVAGTVAVWAFGEAWDETGEIAIF